MDRKELINRLAENISRKTGVEGPSHDPYGWEEMSVTLPIEVVVKVHRGLGEWANVMVGNRELVRAEWEDIERLLADFGLTGEDFYDAYEIWYEKYGREAAEIAALERAAGWDPNP